MNTIEQIKQEISQTDCISYSELELTRNDSNFHVFKSWEFYQVFYLSNSDLYYLDEETEESLNLADNIIDTSNGRIYCFI